MNIDIRVVPHDSQRYETCGDWVWEDDTLCIAVSDMKRDDFNFLVGIHEQVEAYLCRKNGVDEVAVTAFDLAYEASRPEWDKGEPGDHPDAPYHKEHRMASDIESYLAAVMHVDWREYEEAVNALCKTKIDPKQ